MFRLRLPEKQAGLSAGLGGFGWCERRIEVRFVWARRMFGAGLARVWRGFGAGLVGVSEGRPENKTKLGFLPL